MCTSSGHGLSGSEICAEPEDEPFGRLYSVVDLEGQMLHVQQQLSQALAPRELTPNVGIAAWTLLSLRSSGCR